MNYRADIDGLRALAVLMVVFYHAGFDFIPGGFVGVDVFFVISGYLITGIILREQDEGRFSFSSFYVRRMKRILPAFYVVGFSTVFVGYFLLLPSDYVSLANSFFAASTFTANIYFWLESGGYFSSSADEMPLLHTWSLSVEEQFYFLWPLFFMFLCTFFSKRAISLITGALIIISFFVAEALSRQLSVLVSSASYFLLPTKAGELLLGSLLAFLPATQKNCNRLIINFLAIVGLFAVILPAFLLDRSSIFPGFYSFIPCIGTALLIFTGGYHQTVLHQLLCWRPVVFIGLISYSLYLWHWPLVAYAKYLQFEFTAVLGIFIVVLSIFVSYLSWRYVEQPTRHGIGFAKTLLRYFVFPFVVCGLVFFIINQTDGGAQRLADNGEYLEVKRAIRGASLDNGWCHDNDSDFYGCLLGETESETRALLWGDSHGGAYSPFVDILARELNISVVPLTYSSCTPFIKELGNGANIDLCRNARAYAKKSLSDEKYDLIFLVARMDSILKSFRLSIEDYFEAIEFASGHAQKVIVLAQAPVFEANSASIALRRSFLGDKMGVTQHVEESSEWVDIANTRLVEFTDAFDNVDVININNFLKVNERYMPIRSEILLYSDTNHLNILGAQFLARKYIESLDGSVYLERLRNEIGSF
jgi:peptidoglycan/LPS O-acetylase OafA/YrhL